MSETREQAPAEPVPDTVEQEIHLRAKEVAWDEGPLELTWESNHSCGIARYGCCGGGKNIDRAALAKNIEEALRWAFAAGAQGEREALRQCVERWRAREQHLRRKASWQTGQLEAERFAAIADGIGDCADGLDVLLSATPPDAPAGRE